MSEKTTYKDAGVDIDAGERAVHLMKDAVQRTYTGDVLAGLGAFGGLFDAARLKHFDHPVLVSSTDSVGTKTSVAAALGRYDTIGKDIVHHCLNDILVQGARPLYFLDYIASSRLEPEIIATIVQGVAEACHDAGMPLLGGETAEMPGVYRENEFDLVGAVVGVVEKATIIDGGAVQAGDRVLALASGGLQTNGYSLARKVLAGSYHEAFGSTTLGEALLVPHRSYLETVAPLLASGLVKGMAHITGGGMPGNLPRVLPGGLGARVELGSWPVPPIFELIAERAQVAREEMFSAFNMGAGYLLVTDKERVAEARAKAPEELYDIGEIVAGQGVDFV